jgi:hypothetical protein
VLLTRRLAGLLLLAGAFQWLVWPNFLRVVWRDDRAFDAAGDPTAFLLVHVAIVVPALLIGTALLVLGGVAWRHAPVGAHARTRRPAGVAARDLG